MNENSKEPLDKPNPHRLIFPSSNDAVELMWFSLQKAGFRLEALRLHYRLGLIVPEIQKLALQLTQKGETQSQDLRLSPEELWKKCWFKETQQLCITY